MVCLFSVIDESGDPLVKVMGKEILSILEWYCLSFFTFEELMTDFVLNIFGTDLCVKHFWY